MAVVGFILDILRPRKAGKLTAPRQEWLVLKRLRRRTDISACDAGLQAEIRKERRTQRFYRVISAVLAAMVPVSLLAYLLTGDRFSREDINGSVLGLIWVLIPVLAANLAWELVSGPKYAESCRREMGLLKPVASPGVPSGSTNTAALRLAVLAAAILLLGWGFFSGGAADVLTKAINICTECIGLG